MSKKYRLILYMNFKSAMHIHADDCVILSIFKHMHWLLALSRLDE